MSIIESMKLGERKHDGWCATETHTVGKCNCHLSEIAKLKTENETLLGGLADIAYSDDMILEVAQKKAARLYSYYKMGLVVGHAEMYDSGEIDEDVDDESR